jgi:hypothetical protein
MRVSIVLTAMFLMLLAPAAHSNVKAILGWVETVAVGPDNVTLLAKLDTGAATSSMHATNIKRFRRGGKRYVRFQLSDGDGGYGPQLERRLVRIVRIKRHGGDFERRPVVELPVCLADLERVVEFSLVDRSHFDHPVLLGRSALSGFVLVDPQIDGTSEPMCRRPAS